MAQAANESAFGTSRFARLGNNLFGEMVFTARDEGIMPLNRPEGGKYRARIFPTLPRFAPRLLNLNTHPAYQELRQIRAELQLRGEDVRGIELVRGLQAYSTRREAYVDDIRAIIHANNLPKYTANASLRHKEISPSIPVVNIPPQTSRQFYGRDVKPKLSISVKVPVSRPPKPRRYAQGFVVTKRHKLLRSSCGSRNFQDQGRRTKTCRWSVATTGGTNKKIVRRE